MAGLQKVFNLIKKTGDRCIVLSADGEDANVIMSLVEYERLALGRADVVDLTEDELLDKINRDISIWKTQQEDEEKPANPWFSEPKPRETMENWDDTFEDELADTAIRLFDLCGGLGIDLEKQIEWKMSFNKTREKLHGKAY